jgi:O-succinylbenzoate synthase
MPRKIHLLYRRYRLPFRAPVRTAHGVWAEREGVIVRIEDEAGAVGYGEAATLPHFGTETPEEVEAALQVLGEWTTDDALAAVPVRLGCLRFALAAARGADPEERPDAREYLGVAALLPAGRAALAEAVTKADGGFRVFKWKVGVGDIADELALLDDLCAALPSGAKLRLDANGAWDRRRAERWLERCADRPVEHVEQPCLAAAADGAAARRKVDDMLLGLAADFPTPVALDESLVGDGDVDRWIGAGWPGVYVIKPSLLGDAPGLLARLELAQAKVVFSSALETAVGARAALRVAFRWRGEPRALGFGAWPLLADPRCDGPHAAPFFRREDVEAIRPEAVWTALS